MKPFLHPTLLGLSVDMSLGGMAHADDLAMGQKLVSNHCAGCHTFEQGGPPGQGPNLFDLLGRKAAS